VPDLCECLPISLILTGYCHIYYATDCYRDTSAVYIKLQSLIPMLCHTINRGDINRSTTSTAATLHYWTDLFFADVVCKRCNRIKFQWAKDRAVVLL